MNGGRRAIAGFFFFAEQMLLAVNSKFFYSCGFELPAEQQYQLPACPLNDLFDLLPLWNDT